MAQRAPERFSPCLSSLAGPQGQYRYLYEALLSLVSAQETPSGPLPRSANGRTEPDPADSLESLV